MGFRTVVIIDNDFLTDYAPSDDAERNRAKLEQIYNALQSGVLPRKYQRLCPLIPTVVECVHADSVSTFRIESFSATQITET